MSGFFIIWTILFGSLEGRGSEIIKCKLPNDLLIIKRAWELLADKQDSEKRLFNLQIQWSTGFGANLVLLK